MSRVRMNEQWRNVIDDFERHYPTIAEDVIDWYPIGRNEISIETSDGSKYVYMFIGNKLIKYHDPNKDCVFDEMMWRQEFSKKLQQKMIDVHMGQDELSEKTGISKVSLSKYMNGRAIPSVYNVDRIAMALCCSVSELTNNRGL